MKSTKDIAIKLGLSQQRIRVLAAGGRITPKPKIIGGQWVFADSIKISIAPKFKNKLQKAIA